MQHFAAVTVSDWAAIATAIGGVGAFLATARLAYLARKQMTAALDQVTAAQDQVDVMRQAAADDAATVKGQIDASVQQGEAIREAARAQLQPIVFAHGDKTLTWLEGTDKAEDNEYMIGPGQIGFGYKLANEGTGLALNIRHGVDIGGKRLEWGEGKRWRALRAGEWQPAQDFLDQGVWIRIRPFAVVCNLSEVADWATQPRHYWAEFDSVFGERFWTRNPSDPTDPAGFGPTATNGGTSVAGG
jgi:hypothetical protein